MSMSHLPAQLRVQMGGAVRPRHELWQQLAPHALNGRLDSLVVE